MKKLLAAAALAVSSLFAPAHAALLDFAAYADAHGEQALANGAVLNIDSVNVRIFSGITIPFPFPLYHPYLDEGNAGLGVCKEVGLGGECEPASDDNVNFNEALLLTFPDGARSITSLTFRDADHNLIEAGNNGFIKIYTDAGNLTALFTTFIAMAAGGDAFFANTRYIGFAFVTKQFYVSAVGVSDVPVPGALPLLLSGLAGLTFAGRKRKA